MPDNRPSNSTILAAYRERTPRSAALAAAAQEVLPSGISHDARHLDPYGIYVERAKGPRKWDVDGNEYVDYYGGHGALLLGHGHPAVLAATQEALAQGTQFGANHPGEVRWAELVQRLVRSAERVRFTSSGTEATLMALRLARAVTGKTRIVRFLTHFHGWHDHMTAGHASHFDGTPTTGVLAEIATSAILLPPGDIAALRAALAAHDDIAAAILEPTGSGFGAVPHSRDFVAALREETAKRGIILIFDEVVTGFRVSPGGAQGEFGILPDLTALAKILAGGMPGGAVCGRKDILDELDFSATARNGREKIAHPGTYNANPVSAAAGCAALAIVAEGEACKRANAYAAELRGRLN
jgi:glutamate-1-semialdehyde 2,1-aminomutase